MQKTMTIRSILCVAVLSLACIAQPARAQDAGSAEPEVGLSMNEVGLYTGISALMPFAEPSCRISILT